MPAQSTIAFAHAPPSTFGHVSACQPALASGRSSLPVPHVLSAPPHVLSIVSASSVRALASAAASLARRDTSCRAEARRSPPWRRRCAPPCLLLHQRRHAGDERRAALARRTHRRRLRRRRHGGGGGGPGRRRRAVAGGGDAELVEVGDRADRARRRRFEADGHVLAGEHERKPESDDGRFTGGRLLPLVSRSAERSRVPSTARPAVGRCSRPRGT